MNVFRLCRFLLLTLVVLVMCMSATTCAAEDVLRLLVWEGYAPESFRDRFEKLILDKYGRKVTLEVTYITGPDSLFAPIRKREVDLVSLTHHHFNDGRFNFISNGLLIPLDSNNIPGYSDLIPELRDAEYLRKENDVFGIPICQGVYGLAYNVERMEPAPTSWRVLWDPEHKGAYTIGANEYLYNVCMTALAMGYPRKTIGQFTRLDSKKFREQLRLLAENAGGFWVGQDKMEDLAGKNLSVGWGDALNGLRERGERWQTADPEEGSLYWVDSLALTWALDDKPFLKVVAEEWINYVLAPEYQVDQVIRTLSQWPTTTTVSPRLTEAERERLHVGEADFFREKNILLPTFSHRDRNGLKLLWDEAMEGIKVERQ